MESFEMILWNNNENTSKFLLKLWTTFGSKAIDQLHTLILIQKWEIYENPQRTCIRSADLRHLTI